MTVYVGMDVHRKRSQVAVLDDAGVPQHNRNLPNDPAKLIPDATEASEKITFLGTADKQGSAYLRSALLAVLHHFNAPASVPFGELPRVTQLGRALI